MANGTISGGRLASHSRPVPTSSAHGSAEDTPDPRRWLTLAVVLPAAFLGTLDFFIVNLAMPSIRDSLHATPTHLQFVIAAYGLAYAVCLITGGRLGDLYGRRLSFLCGVAGFTFASVLCGLALQPEHLVAARALQGVSGALMFPQVLSIIHVSFPERERGLAFGLFGASQGAAALAGMLLGGVLVEANFFDLQWRPIFLVNLPLGVLTLFAAGRLVRESRAPVARKLDLFGVALVSLTLVLFILPLAEGRSTGWTWWIPASLAASGVTLICFLRYEIWLKSRDGSPLVDLALFHDRTFVLGLLTSLSFCSGLSAFFLIFTLFLQSGLLLNPSEASLVFAPFAVGYLGASSGAVLLARRLGSRMMNLGALLMAIGLGIVILLVTMRGASLTGLELAPVLMLYGIGQGLVFPKLISTALSRVPVAEAGSASGVLMTVQQIAFSVGVTVIGSIFFISAGDNPAPDDYKHALCNALMCNMGLLIVTFGLALLLPHGIKDKEMTLVPIEV